MAFTRVCHLSDFKPGQAIQADLGAEQVMLLKHEGQILATSRVCLHRGGNLAKGELDGSIVTCPLHFWKFDLNDGKCLQVPSAKLKTYATKTENDEVYIDA